MTPPNDVTSGHAENATAAWAESGDGEFLWLWYVVFTVLLLGLIVASFVRFHYKRVQQARQRLDAEMTYGVKRRHMTPSPSSGNVVMTPAAVVNLDTQKLLTSHHNDVRGGHAGEPEVVVHQRSRGREDGEVKRAPVVYTFNANGSMVDVRCEQVERCNTFRFDNDYSPDDQRRYICLPSSEFDVEDLKTIDELRRKKSCLKNSHDPLTSRMLGHEVDGDLPQSNHHPHLPQLHLISQHHHHQQQQQQRQKHPRQRLSPFHHRYRHRQKMSGADTGTSLLHPSRLGREERHRSDPSLGRVERQSVETWPRVPRQFRRRTESQCRSRRGADAVAETLTTTR